MSGESGKGEAVELRVLIAPGEPIRGTVERQGRVTSFRGWIELMGLINAARGQPRPKQEDPAREPGDEGRGGRRRPP